MRATARRYLVIVRAGTRSLHPHWLGPEGFERNWDLQLSTYDEGLDPLPQADLPTVVDTGTKWDSMVRHFQNQPELLDRYSHIMLADDDVMMRGEDINRLFELSEEHGLAISQFALSRDSWVTYPALMQCPGYRLRYTNHIDCMAPCFESAHLKSLLPFIEKYPTGWGADHTWAMLMDEPAYRCALVDEMTMVHTRKFNSDILHATFALRGMDPDDEVRQVLALFSNFPGCNINYAGVLPDGRRVGSTHVQWRNGWHLIFSSMRTHTPYKVFRKGVGMLVQIATRHGHVPEKLRYRSEPRRKDASPSGMAELSI